MELTFKKIVRHNIFNANFLNISPHNKLTFPESGIVIIYGPNGIGKSSLARVLSKEDNTEYILEYEGKEYTSADDVSFFHIIDDQNGRNIIQGSAKDFILGDNIRREFELKEAIEEAFCYVFEDVLISTLKKDFGISKKKSTLTSWLKNERIRRYVSDLANQRSKGNDIDHDEFIDFIQKLSVHTIPEHDEEKLRFLVDDVKSADSVITQLRAAMKENVSIDPTMTKVVEHEDAIAILSKYYYLSDCVVCDNNMDRDSLLKVKQQKIKSFMNKLDKNTKDMLQRIQKRLDSKDPFQIKKAIFDMAINNDTSLFEKLLEEIEYYICIVDKKISNLFAKSLDGSSLVEHQQELDSIVSEKPELTDEDVLFIEKFVNNSIDKEIELIRDDEGNLQLLLDKKPFLNKDRQDLHLSNGEQNFISIAFELLKAQKVDAEFIVLDDPISSFDSIYKNKIVYAIAKFLVSKKQILLTHSTDLVKLLEHQKSSSFNLYILNNSSEGKNGFIQVFSKEQKLLLYLHKLVDFFRVDVLDSVQNERLLLIALVPFMRSFSRIVNEPAITRELTEIMHGYGEASVNLTKVYNKLFGSKRITKTHSVSVSDILQCNVEPKGIIILNPDEYPLLNRALIHILNYLWLRLYVEKTLVQKYKINTNKYDQLSRIIIKAFSNKNVETIKKRVFLLSRKTLLNEFNHFEQDLNIFQPAIDISDTALQKERDDIMGFMTSLTTSK